MVSHVNKQATMLRLMVTMMISDREIHEREVSVIRDIHRQLTDSDLDEAVLAREISAAQKEPRSIHDFIEEIAPHFDPTEKEMVLKAVFLVGLADGKIRDAEEEMLLEVALSLEISTDRLREIVEETMIQKSP